LKVAVSATGTSLDAVVDPRFGRCPYFVIVETETMQFEAIPNVSQSEPRGAGIQSAQIIAGKGVKVVITGHVGPNAYQALSASGIRVVTGATQTVREAVLKYQRGELMEAGSPTVYGHFGMGRGGPAGRGGRWG